MSQELPKTKRQLERLLRAAWRSGVADAVTRLEKEAERVASTNWPQAQSYQDAIDLLDRFLRKRGKNL